MRIKLSSVATFTARNTNYNGQVRLEKVDTARHCSTKSCLQFCMCCLTARHCWSLFSHIIHAHVNTQICNLLQCTVFNDVEDPSKVLAKFWGWSVHHCYTDVRNSACDAQQLGTVEPWPQVPIPTHMNIQMCNSLQCTVFEEAEHPWIGSL